MHLQNHQRRACFDGRAIESTCTEGFPSLHAQGNGTHAVDRFLFVVNGHGLLNMQSWKIF